MSSEFHQNFHNYFLISDADDVAICKYNNIRIRRYFGNRLVFEKFRNSICVWHAIKIGFTFLPHFIFVLIFSWNLVEQSNSANETEHIEQKNCVRCCEEEGTRNVMQAVGAWVKKDDACVAWELTSGQGKTKSWQTPSLHFSAAKVGFKWSPISLGCLRHSQLNFVCRFMNYVVLSGSIATNTAQQKHRKRILGT